MNELTIRLKIGDKNFQECVPLTSQQDLTLERCEWAFYQIMLKLKVKLYGETQAELNEDGEPKERN